MPRNYSELLEELNHVCELCGEFYVDNSIIEMRTVEVGEETVTCDCCIHCYNNFKPVKTKDNGKFN